MDMDMDFATKMAISFDRPQNEGQIADSGISFGKLLSLS